MSHQKLIAAAATRESDSALNFSEGATIKPALTVPIQAQAVLSTSSTINKAQKRQVEDGDSSNSDESVVETSKVEKPKKKKKKEAFRAIQR
jgi:hypothetical protein